MPTIIFKDAAGEATEIAAKSGYTLMETAVDNGIEAIVAECGGACACATCHVYIDDAWVAKLPQMEEMEDAMLDAALERQANSRLSCQIEVTDELDGLSLTVAQNG